MTILLYEEHYKAPWCPLLEYRDCNAMCKITSDTSDALWSLFIRKIRVDGCTMGAKIVALAWWASETQVSPNKPNVTRQCFKVGVWDEKATHYLLVT
jgi:hypothetical protein